MLILFPIGATIYLVIITIDWTNKSLNYLFFHNQAPVIPGLGIFSGFVVITVVGFLFTRAFTKPIVHLLEKLLTRTPVINIIYSSLKDLTEALVGEQKKFNKPVMVEFSSPGLKRFGFITQESMENYGLKDTLAVYCPHSYNISGNVYIVPSDKVTPLDVDPADLMRFVASGGITKMLVTKGANKPLQKSSPKA